MTDDNEAARQLAAFHGDAQPHANTTHVVKMQASGKRGMTLDDLTAFVDKAREYDVPGSVVVTGDWYAMRRTIKRLEVST